MVEHYSVDKEGAKDEDKDKDEEPVVKPSISKVIEALEILKLHELCQEEGLITKLRFYEAAERDLRSSAIQNKAQGTLDSFFKSS